MANLSYFSQRFGCHSANAFSGRGSLDGGQCDALGLRWGRNVGILGIGEASLMPSDLNLESRPHVYLTVWGFAYILCGIL